MTTKQESLAAHLAQWAAGEEARGQIAATILAIAEASVSISRLIAWGPLAGQMGEAVGDNADGDAQKKLDVLSNDALIEALGSAPVAVIGSEENETALPVNKGAPLAVAMDPLDGSSNIETNVSVGTIFSVLPAGDGTGAALLQPGVNQLAAGFVIYGPQTAMVLTVREGTHIFTLNPGTSEFQLTTANVCIPASRQEYAINASNYNQWEEPLRAFIDDCVSGDDVALTGRFNMRWIASLVAEAFRIMVRGGVFLYPRDGRPGYENGRLRLVYEANPLALLVEQANGMATDSLHRILDVQPASLHERVPLIFGSAKIVERVANYHTHRHSMISRSPLFARRGLFRS